MRRFFQGITKHKIAVVVIYTLLALVCFVMWKQVSVNYDMNDYLPDEAASSVSLDKMQEEFSGDITNARVMVKDVSVAEALAYKHKIEDVDDVSEVEWLDDDADIYAPLDSQDKETVEKFYKDRNALFKVTIDKNKRISAVNEIGDVVGDDNCLTGSAVSTAIATQSTVKEIQKITVIAVLFVLLVLILTTHSWIEPLIVLLGLGVALLLNSGTNLIFGEISFVSNAAGSILQLAVSLDYSVFLIHRFEETRSKGLAPKDAMVEALLRSGRSILSSGLTTVIGFLALLLMRFGIGPDLGLVLAKGTAISLIVVFTFVPALTLCFEKAMTSTRHKSLYPSFTKFGKFVNKATIPLVCIFVLILTPAYLAANSNSYYYGSSHIYGQNTEYGTDAAEIQESFGNKDTYVVLVPKGDKPHEQQLADDLKAIDGVESVTSYSETVGDVIPYEYLDADTLSKLESDNYSRLILSINATYEGDRTFGIVEQIRSAVSSDYPNDSYVAGEGVSTYDLMDTVTSDMLKVNLVAILAVFIVLAITMKSIIVPFILVISIEAAIYVNIAIPYFTDQTVFYIAYLIISSVQLGATVDYAILFTNRYKENRTTLSKHDSIVKTIDDVFVSVCTSGSVLACVGLLIYFMSTNGLLSQLGLFVGRGALVSLFVVLFILPGLLSLFDRFVVKDKSKQKGLLAERGLQNG